jgi:hypothetical protein
MDPVFTKVLSGIVHNGKAAERYLQRDYPAQFFYEQRHMDAPHGYVEAGFIAKCALVYYAKHAETVTWDFVAKILKERGAKRQRIKAYKKCWDVLGKHKGIKRGAWEEQLDTLLKDYREFRHKDLYVQLSGMYGKGCFSHYPDGECKTCAVRPQCQAMIKSGDKNRSDWILDWAAAQTEQIKLETRATHIRVYDVNSLLIDGVKQIDIDRAQLDEDGNLKIRGISTPFPKFTKHIGGWMPGRLYMIGARSGQGKSAFLLQCANEAARAGHPVLYFNLEMPVKEELRYRIMSYLTGVEFSDLMTKQVSDDALELLETGVNDWLKALKLPNYQLVDIPLQTKLSTIFRHIDTFMAKVGRRDILVVLDYFNLLYIPPNVNRPDLWWAQQAEMIHAFCRDRYVPFLSALQLNRQAEGARRLGIKHIRDSDKIIDNADGFWGFVSLSEYMMLLQGIKGRYFLNKDFLLKKELKRMGFVEHEKDQMDDDEAVL